jgi:signal peptidase II
MAGASRLMRGLTVVAVILGTIGCDRVAKQAASRHLAGRPRLSMAGDSIRLEYVENRGGFLSVGAELPQTLRVAAFSVGTALILAWLGLWLFRQVACGRWALGYALLWAGGVGNLADRIAHGRVIDFVNVGVGSLRTGIFNLADVAITVGVALVVLDLTRPDRVRTAAE